MYAQGGLIDLPGYYQDGGDTPQDDEPQGAQSQLQAPTPLPRPDPRSYEEKLTTSPEARAQFEQDMRGLAFGGSQPAPQPQVPLPRPRPPEAPLPGDIPSRPGPADLATQAGLHDLPPWRAMGPRSIGTSYDPTTPVPEEIARQQRIPTVSPHDLRAWDAWEAQQRQSGNVEDRRTPEQIAEDTRRWGEATFVPAPWVGDRPPPWTVTRSSPSRPRARGGLVNFRQTGGDVDENKFAQAARQGGQLMLRALDTSPIGKASGFQFGGIAKPQLGIPQMTGYARGAHFSGPNTQHAAVPGVHLINSSVPGRVDRIPMRARSGSYVLPSDVVSGMGQGNTNAGAKMWGNLISHSIGPMGIQNAIKQRSMPSARLRMTGATKTFAGGGANEYTPIITAGGECLVDPEIVRELGDGDSEEGKKVLANSVAQVRKQTLQHIKALPKPVS